MSTEWIKIISVERDGVYLLSKSNNDDNPYRTWKCNGLTDVYNAEGQKGLDREVVRMLCEYAEIRGHHPSVERYRSCLSARGHFSGEYTKRINAEYDKLTPEDIATRYVPDTEKTAAMLAYEQFASKERNDYYTRLAGCAVPLKDRSAQDAR